jgi:phosphoribosylanthranilate isomerase
MFVKVCGLSTPESVREAAGAGADAVGFVLTRSPREVTPARARELLADVPARTPALGV